MEELRYTIVYNSKIIRRFERHFTKNNKDNFPAVIPAMVWKGNQVHMRGMIKPRGVLLNHELIHLAQIRECGNFGKYLRKYFREEQGIPYSEKSTEREAFMHQWDMDYIPQHFGLIPVLENEIYE